MLKETTLMDLPNPLYLKLDQQRQSLKKMEADFKNQKQWLQKREEIENNLATLQEEIKREFYQRHQKGNFEEEAILLFQKMKEKKIQQLHELKRVQYQIDTYLDEIEDITEEKLQQQRFNLLQAHWQLHPAKRKEQETLWHEWSQLRILEIDFLHINKVLERLAEHLHFAIQARQSIKGKGILNYIFGTSPNMIIEKQLLGIYALILNNEPLFKKMIHCNPPKPMLDFLNDLFSWLEQTKNTCCKSWSFRHLDAVFSEFKPILIQMSEQSKKWQQQISERIEKLNEDIQQWIEEM